MIKKSRKTQLFGLALAAGFVLLSGASSEIHAQRDPFEKSPLTKPRVYNPNPTSGQPRAEKPKPAGPPPVVALGAPPIEQRINYYKQMREDAASNGLDIPKVTSVLTLDELSVIGIFRTPRGYAAMVQAKPINLSYTIYPGEKFFDGQLVAVEENRLVFRKVTKMSNGKFTAGVENKTLRQYTLQEEVQGTAPIEQSARGETTNSTAAESTAGKTVTNIPASAAIVSPLEEMMKQPTAPEKSKETAKDKKAVKGKKAVKIAGNKKP